MMKIDFHMLYTLLHKPNFVLKIDQNHDMNFHIKNKILILYNSIFFFLQKVDFIAVCNNDPNNLLLVKNILKIKKKYNF